jgi:hypothetical protein
MSFKKVTKFFQKILKNWFLKVNKEYLIFETKSILKENRRSFEEYDAKIGVVIQGPLNLENNFSFESIRYLRNSYPNISIVLSSWEGENENVLYKIEELDIKILKSKLLSNRGIKNVNLQIESAKVGIQYLKELGCEYAFKLRTDQCLDTSIDFVGYSLNLIHQFPLSRNTDSLKSRLLISSLNTYKNRYYGVSDMFMFGHIDDMEKYWSPKLDSKEMGDFEVELDDRYYMRQETAEGYLICEFMKSIKYQPQWTFDDHKSFMGQFFIIFDFQSLGHFWFKNNWWEANQKANEYLSFATWLNMYSELLLISKKS